MSAKTKNKRVAGNFRLNVIAGGVVKITAVLLMNWTLQASASESFATNFSKEINNLNAIQKKVKGKVTDESGLPVPGANIRVKDGTASVQTDMDGNFSISVPSAKSVLIITYVGMEDKEVVASGESITVVLREVGQKLDEVVVQVAYGTQKKKTLTGAQAAVNQKALQDRPITSLTTGLQGTMSGVTVTTTNGQPGKDGVKINIRGIGTLNNSDPLVVVDGVIASMSEVNPSDVESVTVLKDAASSAIYGSRAANGVILVTTKKGKKGGVQVHFESNTGLQTLGPLPDYLPSWQQATMFNQAKANEGTADA